MIRKLRICAGTWRRSVRQSTDAAFYRLTFVEWLRRLQTRLASVRSTWCWQSSTIKVSRQAPVQRITWPATSSGRDLSLT